jgi:hypothetical protein
MENEQLTSDNMHLNDVPPPGFPAQGKSLITELEKLREAVVMLCDLQREVAKKLDAVLLGSTTNEHKL